MIAQSISLVLRRAACLVASLLLSAAAFSHQPARQYARLLGYYRVLQSVDSVPAYFVDGMVEFYVPLDTVGKESTGSRPQFVGRRFLGERRRKARWAVDDTFVRMSMPALEQTSLAESVGGEEYSLRNNGDIYRWGDWAGRWDSLCVVVDELTGQAGHELPLDELRLYGIVARLVRFDDTERYARAPYRLANLASSVRRQTIMARYRGEDEEEKVEVWSEFYVTRRDTVSDEQRRKLMKRKEKDLRLDVPDGVPQPEASFLRAWNRMEEY